MVRKQLLSGHPCMNPLRCWLQSTIMYTLSITYLPPVPNGRPSMSRPQSLINICPCYVPNVVCPHCTPFTHDTRLQSFYQQTEFIHLGKKYTKPATLSSSINKKYIELTKQTMKGHSHYTREQTQPSPLQPLLHRVVQLVVFLTTVWFGCLWMVMMRGVFCCLYLVGVYCAFGLLFWIE